MKGPDVRAWNVFGYAAVFFFVGLLIAELFGEIPTDIDFKPFFIPILLAVSVPVRYGWAVGWGAAVGEGFGDLIEGYEVDDPVGFVTYILAFACAAYIVGGRPERKGRLLLACVAAATINAIPEATAFYLLRSGAVPLDEAVRSAVGNIVTHGLVMGAVPTLLLAGVMTRPLARALGFDEEQRVVAEQRAPRPDSFAAG